MSIWSRAGWGAGAVLFFATLVITTAIAIQSSHSNNQASSSGNLISCTNANSGPPNQQPGKDGKVKGAKLADFTPPQKISSIACLDYRVGTGASASSGSTVSVNYVGALASSGVIFDDSFDSGPAAQLSLSSVIAGWQLGVPGMKVGGIRRLYIPASLGYGAQSGAGIPANSDLIFDIQLTNVQ